MSFEICNRCTVRNCRSNPQTDRNGRGACRKYREYRSPKPSMLEELWNTQPVELLKLLGSVGLSGSVGTDRKLRLERR